MNQNVVILGGNGFIGRNIAQYMIKQNKKVTVYDLAMPQEKIDQVTYKIGDCADKEKLEEAFKGQDVVIHLANSILPQSSMQNPLYGYETEVENALNILKVCKKYNIKRIIFASSGGTIYGHNGLEINSEEAPTRPINHYGIVKRTIEDILMMQNELDNMENIVLRISNPFGTGQNIKQGVGAITAFGKRMIEGNAIQLFGDGNIVRDYIAIEEVAKAFGLACDWAINREIVPIFNIGSGEGHSLKQLIEIISNYLEIEPAIEYLPERKFDVKCNILDITKAQKYLKYDLQYSSEIYIRKYIAELQKEVLKP